MSRRYEIKVSVHVSGETAGEASAKANDVMDLLEDNGFWNVGADPMKAYDTETGEDINE